MLWDESFETWLEIGITAQPSAVLLAADGTPIQGWIGPFPEDDVLRNPRDESPDVGAYEYIAE